MKRYEYMRMPIEPLPQELVEEHDVTGIQHEGYIFIETHKRMYGLLQAGKIANEELQEHLTKVAIFQLSIHLTCGNIPQES
eukprot:6526973-Ditylum_brightwellii.AAC.2